jgi:hypothetical protein
MVCATVHDQGSRASRASIAGGFVLIPIASIMTSWEACRSRPLGTGDFRAWLAAHEMVARRCTLDQSRQATYTLAELAGLLGITHKRARASLRRLEAAGLIAWSDLAIHFPDQADDTICEGFSDTIARGTGPLAIPRRILRLLADGARPAIIATVLGLLLRCLSRRRGGFDGRGRIKAAWVSRAFGVSLRQVKAARRELVELGWIHPENADQWSWNRWGGVYTIDLQWSPASPDGSRSTPPPAHDGSRSTPPDLHPEPLRESKNQEPASAGPAGVHLSGFNQQSQTLPKSGPLPPPRLDDVRVEDLRDTGRLLELHGQAVASGVISASEADRLRLVAAAEHAIEIGEGNPAGLFIHLVRGRCWRYLTGAEEDRANARIKAHSRPPTRPEVVHGPAAVRAPARAATDGEIVRAVRAAMIRAGVFRDPFPEFLRLNPGWSRERWDRALEG